MRKIFNKVLAGITSVALVATLLVGVNVTKTVKAEDTAVELNNWTFLRGGVEYNSEYLNGNEGRINKVTMDGTGEILDGWLTLNPAEQKKTATQKSTGFTMDIANTGWDKGWDNDTINPWQIQAQMNNVDIKKGHTYTVSFKASSSKKKYAYLTFGCDVEGTAPYGEDIVDGSRPIIAIMPTEATYTYTFTNWVSATKLSTIIMLGDFSSDAKLDYAGNSIADVMTENETGWSGTVSISDFTITDRGQHPDYVPEPPKPTTEAPTVKPTEAPTQAPTVKPSTVAPTVKKLAKVKKLKVKNNKKGTIKITWKKVANATSYQIKVGKKTYTSKKAKKTVKKLKKGKKYTVKVRAKAAGYKTAKWAKKTIRIKK